MPKSKDNDYLTMDIEKLRKQHAKYVNGRFKDAQMFDQYQNKKKNGAFNAKSVKANTVLSQAYPAPKYNKDGKLRENRNQMYIDTAINFSENVGTRIRANQPVNSDEIALETSLEVYSLLATLETQRNRILKNIETLKEEFSGKELESQIALQKNTIENMGKTLDLALAKRDQQMREHRAATAWGRFKNDIDDKGVLGAIRDRLPSLPKIQLPSSLRNLFSKKEDPTPIALTTNAAKPTAPKVNQTGPTVDKEPTAMPPITKQKEMTQRELVAAARVEARAEAEKRRERQMENRQGKAKVTRPSPGGHPSSD